MLFRKEYRACLKENIDEAVWKNALTVAKNMLNDAFLEVMLYRKNSMLFLYFEERTEENDPEVFFSMLNEYLETWPEENGLRHWAYMYPIFYQQIPDSEKDWIAERNVGKTKVGRIAFLKEEKLFSYTYYHKALVDEGLLKGDKYQYISLHENILFSYYEEPRNNVNLSGKDAESEVIGQWLALDPGSHFETWKTDGKHFEPLPAILEYYAPKE